MCLQKRYVNQAISLVRLTSRRGLALQMAQGSISMKPRPEHHHPHCPIKTQTQACGRVPTNTRPRVHSRWHSFLLLSFCRLPSARRYLIPFPHLQLQWWTLLHPLDHFVSSLLRRVVAKFALEFQTKYFLLAASTPYVLLCILAVSVSDVMRIRSQRGHGFTFMADW